MARPRFHVQHFVACPSVVVARATPQNPYTLRDVGYFFEVSAEEEWPVRLADLWLYVRFFNGTGRRDFAVQVVWLDSPAGEQEVGEFSPITVQFMPGEVVLSRAWRVAAIRFPGPGRYAFRLRRLFRQQLLAEEFIELRRLP